MILTVRNGSCQTIRGRGKGYNKTRHSGAKQGHSGAKQGHSEECDDEGDMDGMEHGGRHGRV